jgi:ribulose-5-phosphate 4-epimerase/fuculose-1-phosphate aldolase
MPPGHSIVTSAASRIPLDERLAGLLLKYAALVVARGYVHNSLGNIAIRAPHPDFPDGVVYTKHAEVSLEEMTVEHVVVTDVPTGRLLHGTSPTSVGHQLNREILRRRPDINAVIHVHHDETIAFFASGEGRALRVLSLEFPAVLMRPVHVMPSHINVELDVAPVAAFIQDTNAIVMQAHGITTLGRTISEAYHRLNTLTAEVRRNIVAETLAHLGGTKVQEFGGVDLEEMYRLGERIVYPSRSEGAPPASSEALPG